MTLSIPVSLARRLAVTKQLLAGPRPAPTSDGMMTVFDHLGCIQIDPIPVVDRTQYLVMFSRVGSYDRGAFDKLVYEDRQLFEFWAHAASIVRVADLPIHRHFMNRPIHHETKSEWVKRFRNWAQANDGFREYVLESLRERGPLAAEEIEDRAVLNWESSGWSSNRNVNLMLELLWDRGQIFVAGRNGTRRFWDIPERVLPGLEMVEQISTEEMVRRAAVIAIRALGVATEKHIKYHFTRGRYPGLGKVLKELVKEGVLEEVEVVGEGEASAYPAPAGAWYIHAGDLPLLERLKEDAWGQRTVLLSPFDNLICDRARTAWMFNYDFRIEIYVPPAKRKYGYYVLSVLDGDRFIARLDPRMDRKTGVLTLNAIHAEPGVDVNEVTGRAVASAVQELGDFLGAQAIYLNGHTPEGWRKELRF
ncbi:MAG: YcaQ family DNA glycosylase [Anaerolineales bacterium]|nr:YcaQ family DNA glycosylase [Anaerolineales bacterium]